MALQDTLNLIKKKQQEALQGVSQQRQMGESQFYDQRNGVDVEMAQQQRAMREALARSGQSQGGQNIRANMGLWADRGNKLAMLRNKQMEFMQGLNKSENDINLGAMEQEINAQNEEENRRRQLAAQRASSAKPKLTDAQKADKERVDLTQQAFEALDAHMKEGTADEFLMKNQQELINDLGLEMYKRMLKEKQMRERELRGMM